MRLAVAAGAAFLVGALTQRILLASFAIKVAGMEIPEVAKAAKATEEVLQKVGSQINDLWGAIKDGSSAGRRLTERFELLESQISHPAERDQSPSAAPDHEG
ncbi:MAG: hypothetical protein ACRDYX_03575 [Egibacteraceae bacterium]